MSTGSFSITSVQPLISTPSPSLALAPSGEANGFNTLYQNSLSDSVNSNSNSKEIASAPTFPTPYQAVPRDEDKVRGKQAHTAADTADAAVAHHSSAQHRDKHLINAEKDVAAAKASRKKEPHNEAVDDEAANDILASMAVEQMMANEPTPLAPITTDTDTNTRKKTPETVVATTAPVAQQAQATEIRNDALQQAIALQQIIEQQHTKQNSTASSADALNVLQSTGLLEGTAFDQRDTSSFSSENTATPAERNRSRTTPVTTSQNNTSSALNQHIQPATSLTGNKHSVDAPLPRSQADFGLQHALGQVANGHNGTFQASNTSNLPPIDSEHWNQALASHISNMSRLDQGQTTLTLAPASLGALEVNLQMDRGQADIQFMTRSRQAHEALTSSIDALHHALADQGIQLHNISIVDNNADAGQQTSQQQHAFSGMNSDQQSSQQSSHQSSSQAHEQASVRDTATLSTHEDHIDTLSVSGSSTGTTPGLLATA